MSGILQTLFQNLRSFITGVGFLVKSDGGTSSVLYRVASNSANKTYAVGIINTASTTKLTVSRFTTTGTADLNIALTGPPAFAIANTDAFAITVDSSGNIYAFAGNGSASFSNGIRSVGYSSSGSILFQNNTTTNAQIVRPVSSVIDASGNNFVVLYLNTSCCCISLTSPAIIKYDSSGAVIWGNYYSLSSAGYSSRDVAIDTSGNIWSVGNSNFIRTNSTGTATLFRTTSTLFYGIVIDSSNNIYMTGTESFGANTILCNVSSAGVINWQRKLVIGTTRTPTMAIDVDSSGNIYYAAIGTNTSAPGYTVILKYNSSGTLQWQRTLTVGTTSSTNTYAYDLKVVNNNISIVGTANSGSGIHGFVFNAPTNGALTGTIVNGGANYVYAIGSGTESAGTIAGLTTQANSTSSLSASNTATTLTAESNQLTNTLTTF